MASRHRAARKRSDAGVYHRGTCGRDATDGGSALAPCLAIGVTSVAFLLAGGLIDLFLGFFGLGRDLELLVLSEPELVGGLLLSMPDGFRISFQFLGLVRFLNVGSCTALGLGSVLGLPGSCPLEGFRGYPLPDAP